VKNETKVGFREEVDLLTRHKNVLAGVVVERSLTDLRFLNGKFGPRDMLFPSL
jgi:hypothetical protein